MRFKRHFPEFIKISTVPDHTENLQNVLPLDGNRTTYVYDAKIISLLKKALGFNFQLLHPPDGPYGTLLPDGNWTGIVGMVQREEADIGVGSLSIFTDRVKAVDFTVPYYQTFETFVTDKPKPLSSRYAMLHPFSPLLWGAVLASLIILIVAFYAIKSRKDSSRNLLLMTYASLLGMPVNVKLRTLHAKLLIFFWILGATFITFSYRAVLLSFLTFPFAVGIRDIKQLAAASESSDFKCSTYPGSYMYAAFVNSEEDSLRKIGECLNRSNAFTENGEDFLRPRTYRKAFMEEVSTLVRFRRSYFISEDPFFTTMIAIAVKKTFCCRDVLDRVLLEAASAGLFDKFEKDEAFFGELQLTDPGFEEEDSNRGLTLEDVFGAFVVLGSGHILACFAFVVELLWGRRVKRG